MSSPFHILTTTSEIALDALAEGLQEAGIVSANYAEVQRINEAILESQGRSPQSPVPSPSFRPDAETSASVSEAIATFLSTLGGNEMVVGAAFPLTIQEWIPAGPETVLCLTTGGQLPVGESSPGCRLALKVFQWHRLANAEAPTVFLNVEGMPRPEIARWVERFQTNPGTPVGIELELGSVAARPGVELPPADSGPFRIRSGDPLSSWVMEELDYGHRQQVEQAALRDRFFIYERELNKTRPN